MINELTIQNFKCLRDTKISFEPLTVLIGPNDSGKTSILELIHLVGQTPTMMPLNIFEGSRAIENVTWRRDPRLAPSWELRGSLLSEVEGSDFFYSLRLAFPEGINEIPNVVEDKFTFRQMEILRKNGEPHIPGTSPDVSPALREVGIHYALRTRLRSSFEPATEAFASSGLYRLDPRALRTSATPKVGDVLSPTGNNLAAILDGLLSGPSRRSVNDMEEKLRRAMPTLDGFSTPPAPGKTSGEKTINFVLTGSDKKPVTIPCDLASDGAMLLTAFLALAYSDTPEILLIEEPENGLHPARLKEVIDLLRAMTTGEMGNKRRQIILTTHSPLLLNYARPEEVRIVRRDLEQGTQVTPLTKVQGIDGLLEEFGIGELWYLLGEQGLVEGKKP